MTLLNHLHKWWTTRNEELFASQQRELETLTQERNSWKTLTNQHRIALAQARQEETNMVDHLEHGEQRAFCLGRISAFEEAEKGLETLGLFLSIDSRKPKA